MRNKKAKFMRREASKMARDFKRPWKRLMMNTKTGQAAHLGCGRAVYQRMKKNYNRTKSLDFVLEFSSV